MLPSDEDRTRGALTRRDVAVPPVRLLSAEGLRAGEKPCGDREGLGTTCLCEVSSRAAMRDVFGRMNDGEGNESSRGG
jgi:hypothetical protein